MGSRRRRRPLLTESSVGFFDRSERSRSRSGGCDDVPWVPLLVPHAGRMIASGLPWAGVRETVVAVGAAVALILSLYTFSELVVRRRRASLSARYEYTGDGFQRIIATNHGPAFARHVTFDFGDANVGLSGDLAVPILHAGQDHHISVQRSASDPVPRHAVVSWNDRRRARQSVEIHL